MRPSAILRVASVVTVVAAASGCGLIIGDYEARETDEVDTGESPEDPVLPMQPDVEVRPECRACALEHCDELRQTCLGDPGCRQMLECKNECDDPDCLMWCDWQFPDSLDYDDYRTCVFGPASPLLKWNFAPVPTECEQACNGGENWGCADDYEWKLRESTRVPVQLRLLRVSHAVRTDTNAGFPGLTVRVCEGDRIYPCSYDWEGNTTERGLVEFSMLVPGAPKGAYLEVSHESESLMPLVVHLPPFRSPSRLTRVVPATSSIGAPPSRSPGSGAVLVAANDCTLRPGSNVSFHLDPQGDAPRAGYDPGTGWDFDAEPAGLALFTDVPPSTNESDLAAEVRNADGAVVARQRIWSRADWITVALLEPRASE